MTCDIPLSKRGTKYRNKYSALVDKEDYEKLSKFNWQVQKKYNREPEYLYARRVDRRSGKVIMMHQAVMPLVPSGLEIDHINHNGLDNRKSNLRFATRSQNNVNRSVRQNRKYNLPKGVYKHPRVRGFVSRISHNNKETYLGSFDTAEEASNAHKMAAKNIYGDFASSV